MKSVLEVISSGASFLEKKGVESARLNMEHLLAHVLGLKRMDLYRQFERPLGEKELEPLRGLTQRRAAGEPLQHLLGTAEFYRHTFKCDARALIPRPETEELVEKIVSRRKATPPARVLDMGCGSGIIGLSLAAVFPAAEVVLADASEAALALARENGEALGLAERATFIHSDLFSAVGGRFDVLAANLPYIPAEEIATLSREVRHDPLLALDGGVVGTELMERFIAAALEHAAPGALVAMEHGPEQGPALVAALTAAGFHGAVTEKDLSRRWRFTFAVAA